MTDLVYKRMTCQLKGLAFVIFNYAIKENRPNDVISSYCLIYDTITWLSFLFDWWEANNSMKMTNTRTGLLIDGWFKQYLGGMIFRWWRQFMLIKLNRNSMRSFWTTSAISSTLIHNSTRIRILYIYLRTL